MRDYMAEFGERDYKSMTFNVMMTKPTQHQFFMKDCFQSRIDGIDNDKLIKYICLYYDPKSPLVHRVTDLIERKKAAAILAGFKHHEDRFDDAVIDMMYCRYYETNECIIEFLRGIRNPDWAYICAAWESFHKILTELQGEVRFLSQKGSGAKTNVDIANMRAKLSTEAKKMAEELNEITLRFLSQDESPYLKDHLFDLVDKQREVPKITAERFAGIE